MFDYNWCRSKDITEIIIEKKVPKGIVGEQPIIWAEHCVECAAPDCYNSCEMYDRREDGLCIRFDGGIRPAGRDRKGTSSGAELSYRRWAKLQCDIKDRYLTIEKAERLMRFLQFVGSFTMKVARALPGNNKWLLTFGEYSLRQKLINYKLRGGEQLSDSEFLLWIRGKATTRTEMVVEVVSRKQTTVFRDSFILSEDMREFEIPIDMRGCTDGFLKVCPKNADDAHEISLYQLDIYVVTKQNDNGKEKIKLVIWDLDNTIWDGILAEGEDVSLKEDIINTIKSLDSRGIINSISSKNDAVKAMSKLQEFGIEQYFVFSKINWNPKGLNIEKTIEEMHLSGDAVAFVDDSNWERVQVREYIEGITVMSPEDILREWNGSRFDVTITDDACGRRKTYQVMERTQKELSEWTESVDEFWKQSQLEITVRRPNEYELMRCYELLKRTHKLNSSGRELSFDQIMELYNNVSEYGVFVLFCKDKYGDYGQVGFAVIRIANMPTITDFAVSCRVAGRKIEHEFVKWCANNISNGKIQMVYNETERNVAIKQMINDLKQVVVNNVSE